MVFPANNNIIFKISITKEKVKNDIETAKIFL